MKSFLKSVLVVVAILALGLSIQSCSNPFNPAARFVGKWKCVSHINNGREIKGDGRMLSYEFLPDAKTSRYVIVDTQRQGFSSIPFWPNGRPSSPFNYTVEAGLLKTGNGVSDTYRYEFKGDKLILTDAFNNIVLTFVRE